MKNFILSCIGILFFTAFSTAQDFAMTDGEFVTCSGSFTDSGGITGDYAVSESFTITFCSPFETDAMRVTFNSFDTQFGDILLAYDGDSNTAPFLGVFQGTNSPGTLLASAANTSGCLTFTFISNAAGTSTGWQAAVECFDTCQTITTDIVTVPAIDADGILRLCQGEIVDFTGSATFSNDSAGATYKFRLPDGTEAVGTTLQQTFNDPGVYRIDFVATAPDGCRDRSLEDIVIQVSTTPDFTGTAAADTSICFGESTNITGMVVATEFASQVAPPVSGVTFLPDDSGTTFYETCIDVSGFAPGATLNSAADLLGFFINMEHSYLGDLDITLTAPNGAIIDVKTGGGGNTFLGIPIDVDTDLTPGVGFVYNFTEAPSATQTLFQASGAVATLPAGDYLAEDPFSTFAGTSLNGLWCLRIVDNLGSDNGYIFEWGINFNPLIVPDAERYTPGEVSQEWAANADITATNGNVITVTPTVAGQNCYDYIFTDSFGCTYTETICIDVASEITVVEPNDIIVCAQTGSVAQVDLTARDTQILNGLDPVAFSVTPFGNQADADAASNPLTSITAYDVSTSETVFVRVEEVATGCFEVVELDIDFSTAAYTAVPDLELCDDPTNADGIEVFDLTSQDNGILGTQSSTEYGVTYFLSQADANANLNEILTPGAFDSMGETIYARVSNLQDANCFTTGTFELVVNAVPTIGTGVDVTECDESPIDGATSFDFTVNDSAILNGQSSVDFTVSYYATQSDADAGSNSISTSTVVAGGTIYARIENNITGCYNTSTFNFVVETCEVEVPEGFSPNNDGINDTFSIPGLDQFSNFEMKVFNRLGSVVYETRANNYVEFTGIPNTGVAAGDGLLPVGTYFYVIKFNDPDTEDIASWMYINY